MSARSRWRTAPRLVVACGVAALFAGCGDSSSSPIDAIVTTSASSETTSPPTTPPTAETTSPTAPSTTPPTTPPVETTTEPADSIAGPQPPIDPQLAGQIPTVAGYTLGDLPLDDPYGEVYDFGTELRLHHAAIVDADGVGVGRLIVADTTGERPAIDTFVEHTFAEAVQLPHPGGAVAIDDEFAIVTNAAIPRWTDVDGNAVIRAEQEIDGTVQWAWSADDLVWIVRGDAATEDYVRALLAVHAPTLDPYDQQGMTGDLYDHTPDVPGYGYWDLPRANTIAEINITLVGQLCRTVLPRLHPARRRPRRRLRPRRPRPRHRQGRRRLCRHRHPRRTDRQPRNLPRGDRRGDQRRHRVTERNQRRRAHRRRRHHPRLRRSAHPHRPERLH